MAAETSQTLDRGLRVLDVLAASPGGLTVTELAGRLEVNRTVVYRLVSTLEGHALVRKDPRGRLDFERLYVDAAQRPRIAVASIPYGLARIFDDPLVSGPAHVRFSKARRFSLT